MDKKTYNAIYYRENKERLDKKNSEYYKKNREKLLPGIRVYGKYHYKKNKDIYKKRNHKNYEKNKEKILKRASINRKNNLIRCRDYTRKYRKKNIEKVKECNRIYAKKRRSTIRGRLDNRISSAILESLKGEKKYRTWESLVGYTGEDLKKHLRSKFTKGMTWAKFMSGEIHIDHVVPKSYFKYTTAEDPQFKECWALHNLQPMWAEENMKKGNRIYQLPLPFEFI